MKTYFAGKIKIGDNEQILFIRTREAEKSPNRFHVHEIFTEQDIIERSERLTRASMLAETNINHSDLYRIIAYPFIKGKSLEIDTVTDVNCKSKCKLNCV